MMSLEVTGLDEVIDQLDKMQKKAEELEGENDIPLIELLNEEFLATYSNFNSMKQMFDDYKEDITDDTVDNILNSEQWDTYISNNSQFDNWDGMCEKASEIWITTQLGLN